MLIYKITNTVNGKMYIGKTTYPLYVRKANHWKDLRKKTHVNKYLQNSVNKRGLDKFKIEVIEYLNFANGFTLEDLEKYYISYYKTFNGQFGYNLTSGGEGAKHSRETIEKLKKFKPSPEHVEKIRKLRLGSKNSEHTRGLITTNHASKKEGYINSMQGRNHKLSTKIKIADTKKQTRIICKILSTGVEICFPSIKSACKALDLYDNGIRNCLYKNCRYYKDYHFRLCEISEKN